MIGAGTQPPAVCHFLTFLSIYLLLVNFSLLATWISTFKFWATAATPGPFVPLLFCNAIDLPFHVV